MLNKILVDKAKSGHEIRSEKFAAEIEHSISNSVIYYFDRGSEYDLGLPRHSGMVQRVVDCRIDNWLRERLSSYMGRTCVLNDADCMNPGGFYLDGICSLEEDLCFSTTLYEVLLGNGEYYERNQNDPLGTIGEDVCLYTPDIIVTDDDYNPVGKIDVVSCTPPYEKDLLSNPSRSKTCAVNRVMLILHIVALNGADNMVIGKFESDSFTYAAGSSDNLFSQYAGLYKNYLSNVIYLR